MTTTDLDACLELVADRRRRSLIDQLRNNGKGQTTVDDLVDQIDRGEHATSTDRQPDRDELVIQLHHVHLPKLSEFGVVDYDLERSTVRYLPNEQLEAVVDSLPEEVPQLEP